MKDKIQFAKKLKNYSKQAAIIAGSIAACNGAMAQKTYTITVPPVTVINTGGSTNINVDGFGANDIQLRAFSSGAYDCVYATRLHSQLSFASVNPALASTVAVSGVTSWTGATSRSLACYRNTITNGGNFLGQSNKYLPLKISESGSPLLGWVELSVAANASNFTVHRWGIEQTVSVPVSPLGVLSR